MNETATRRLKGSSYVETRSAVLDLIRSSGTISRVELSHRSALSEMTISKIVRDLLDEGIIVEAGRGHSTGGKRPVLLGLNTGALFAIGVALDPSSTPLVLCRLDGSVVDRLDLPELMTCEPPEAIARISDGLSRLLDRRQLAATSIVGVGVALSGQRPRLIGWGGTGPVAQKWERFDAAAELSAVCGMPVAVENDANCAALGTFWSSATGAVRDFLTVYMAHGIGAGIVIEGSLFRGASNNAGEIGHIIVDRNGLDCWCGSRGCLETVGAPGGIVSQVLADPQLAERFSRKDGDDADTYARVLDAYEQGDPDAMRLITRSADSVADVLFGLTNALDLERIQLTGPGFAIVGDIYASRIRELTSRAAFSRRFHPVVVEVGLTAPDAVARGAASVALHAGLTPHQAAVHH